MIRSSRVLLLIACCFAAACGDDESGNEAVRRGVGAACTGNANCREDQVCLTEFKGGMCGIADCTSSAQCPDGSVCVADPDFSRNFCLLVCDVKEDCNVHRAAEEEANCSSTLNEVGVGNAGGAGGVAGAGGASSNPKVCRPPSG
jgi:hypothetical protein